MNIDWRILPRSAVAVPAALAMVTMAPARAGAEGVAGIDRSAMNENVRPQDDFNAYVNGGWIERTPIPADKPRWGTVDLLRDASDRHQREILEDLASRHDLPAGSDEKKAGDLFASLMDEARAEKLGVEPVRAALARVDAIGSADDLARVFAEFLQTGTDVPAVVYVNSDSHDATRYAVYLTQSGLGLPNRNYYLDESPKLEEIRAAYPGYIAKLFALAGRDDGETAAAAVVRLETEMARAQWTPQDNRDATKTDNRLTVAELAGASHSMAWSSFLDAAGLAKLADLYVRQPSYMTKLGELVRATPLDEWKSYLRFHVLNRAAPWLTADYFQAYFDFFGRRISGLEQPEPRWQRAVKAVNDAVGDAVGRAYVAKYFPPEAKRRMEVLVGNILAAFQDSLEQLPWMTPATKARAQEKRGKLGTKIGYPDKWKDYAALIIQPDDPVGNLERAAAWDYHWRLSRLGGPVDRTDWSLTPQTVNAYYSSRLNEIVFPAAILQPPFFNVAADDAVNYGAIGAVIGHETGHAFDDQGRKTDGEGNLRDWWTPADAEAFQARAEALVAQFDAFAALPGLPVNGRLTLGENIGDLTGVFIAYLAYQKSLGGRAAPVIDGFTGAQRFFMGFAQVWRSKMRPEFARRLALTDPHSPPQFRAIGPLRNFAPFYAAFDVKPGDGMYLPPEQRVTIW